MNHKPAALHLSICLTVLSALISVQVQAADTDDQTSGTPVKAYQMNGDYNLHSEANQESQKFGTLKKTEDVGLKFSPVKNDAKWMKVDLGNGGDGYVNTHALKQIELNGNFVIHADPSLQSHRLGLVSDSKRPENLVLTGNQKTVEENGKKINWLEVMTNGKKAWVASGATHTPMSESQASKQNEIKKAGIGQKEVPLPVPRPSQKSDVKVGFKPAIKPEVESAPSLVPLPVPRPKTLVQTKAPLLKSALAKDLPVRPALAPLQIAPGMKAHAPEVSTLSHPVPPKDIPQIAPVKIAAAKITLPPAPKAAPLKSIECASTRSDYMANTRLRQAYGINYDPFVPWNSMCVNSEPTTGGRWILNICSWGQMIGHRPPQVIIPVSICYNFESGQAYTMTANKMSPFNGRDFDHLTLKSESGSVDLSRSAGQGTVQ